MMEVELQKKERLIEELLTKPDITAAPLGSGPVVGGNFTKLKKLESHLTVNLKRRIKELKNLVTVKTEELDLIKRSVKTTKSQEVEIELRTYMDECQRLRSQLEEVIRSKDTFADPEELKLIEDRFQA